MVDEARFLGFVLGIERVWVSVQGSLLKTASHPSLYGVLHFFEAFYAHLVLLVCYAYVLLRHRVQAISQAELPGGGGCLGFGGQPKRKGLEYP